MDTGFSRICPRKWVLLLSLVMVAQEVASEKSHKYHISQLCKDSFLQGMYRKIDGATLTSRSERNVNCVLTFQTETVLQKFSLRFQYLQLDCNDRLTIYDGAHAIGNPKVELSCRHTLENIKVTPTRTNYLTIKYVTDAWGNEANGFQLVITAFKDKSDHACKENDFKCAHRELCISKDLLCDGVDHCGDSSDEYSTYCTDSDLSFIVLDQTVLIVVCATAGGVAVALAISIAICLCRRRSPRMVTTHPGTLHTHTLPSLSNGTGATQTDSLINDSNQGNVQSPAGVLMDLLLLASPYFLAG